MNLTNLSSIYSFEFDEYKQKFTNIKIKADICYFNNRHSTLIDQPQVINFYYFIQIIKM